MAFLARLGAPVRGFLEFLGDQACRHIGTASGRRGHQANRLAGVGLRAHRAGGQGGSGENDPLTSLHGGPVPLSG